MNPAGLCLFFIPSLHMDPLSLALILCNSPWVNCCKALLENTPLGVMFSVLKSELSIKIFDSNNTSEINTTPPKGKSADFTHQSWCKGGVPLPVKKRCIKFFCGSRAGFKSNKSLSNLSRYQLGLKTETL